MICPVARARRDESVDSASKARRRLDACTDFIGLASAVAGSHRAACLCPGRRVHNAMPTIQSSSFNMSRVIEPEEGPGSRIELAHLSAWFVLPGRGTSSPGGSGRARAPKTRTKCLVEAREACQSMYQYAIFVKLGGPPRNQLSAACVAIAMRAMRRARSPPTDARLDSLLY